MEEKKKDKLEVVHNKESNTNNNENKVDIIKEFKELLFKIEENLKKKINK